MQLSEFQLHRPTQLPQALELAAEFDDKARFLAGGTDLLVDLKQQRYGVEHLIFLSGLDELRGIFVDEAGLHIGALTTLSEIAASPEVRELAPALAEGVQTMAAVQIRNRATIGGNFCAAVPCADTPPICIVLDAQVIVHKAQGSHSVEAQAFFKGPRSTILSRGHVLKEILIPRAPEHTGASYQRFAKRSANALAVAGSAARLTLDGDRITTARVALTSVAPTPLLATQSGALLQGNDVNDALLAKAATHAADEALPISDLRGSLAFRRDLVETLTTRALTLAWQRAQGKEVLA